MTTFEAAVLAILAGFGGAMLGANNDTVRAILHEKTWEGSAYTRQLPLRGFKNPLTKGQPSSDYSDDDVVAGSYGTPYEPPSDYGMGQCRTMAFGRDYTFTLQGGATGFSAKCEYKAAPKTTAGSAY